MPFSTRRLARLILVVGVSLTATWRQRAVEAQANGGNESRPGIAEVTTRFSGVVSAGGGAKKTAVPLRVELKDWHLAGFGRAIDVPQQGFYVAYLSWGKVSTQIGGNTSARTPGDFWTVEKGQRMVVTIEKPGEEAWLQTFSLTPSLGSRR